MSSIITFTITAPTSHNMNFVCTPSIRSSLAPHRSVQFIVHIIITVVALCSISAPPGGLHQLSIWPLPSVLIQQHIQSLFKYPCLRELHLAEDKEHWQGWSQGKMRVKECILFLGLFIKVQPICLTANFRIPYSTCVLWVDYWAIIRQDRTTTENSQRRIVYSKPSFWHQQKG